MYGMKIGLAALESFGAPIGEQIRIFAKAGFEAFSTMLVSDEEHAEYRRIADDLGMKYEYIHAPFHKASRMWSDGAEEAVAELIGCVDVCAKYGVPTMVAHTYIGFVDEHISSDLKIGVENYKRVVDHAASLGVKVAFENTEGERYLATLMDAFSGYSNVGFCWDTGHQMCYNFDKDMSEIYGDRLLVTHLNDNLGVRSFDGTITWHDDLHLLPFDGIGDFDAIARGIARSAPIDVLMFELSKSSKPDRHENDKYKKLSLEEYVAEAYARACRVARLVMCHRGH